MTTEAAGPREIGRFTFTAEEIRRFARLYDPQPFHLDEDAARRSHFGTLVASGWHTVAVWMGFFVRAHAGAAERLPEDHPAVISPVGVGFGLQNLRWPAPVRAGDTIVFLTEILDSRASGSRSGWAIHHRRNSARREDGTEVLSFELRHLAPEIATAPEGAGGLPASGAR
ncbi:MaoC family dehydratase N-terminal domain-containing protein [Xanthobacter dioxanivorans]|uniref:MaoC family dehydratase N-terminal domain-containing protein n=1 Tax=Xanthobacter dioxanivorans TaxID=2528964 RepID=A0A974SK79_9HYPH|nr:MaoC/PaaZ C-terminal domain-containing protein [Xanthobacter dioxanivorans]QRG09206.1 MaoC family dehydratase N-terminal domain-containing protein [Xanthobacter dioxanivorans]